MSHEGWLAKREATRFLRKAFERHGGEKAEEIFQRMADDVVSYEDPGTAYLEEMFELLTKESVASELSSDDEAGGSAIEWLAEHLAQPYVTANSARHALKLLAQEQGGEAAIEWIDESMKQNPSMNPTLYGPIISSWSASEGVEKVGEWLRQQADHPQYNQLAYAYVKEAVEVDSEMAGRWAESISDEGIKECSAERRIQVIGLISLLVLAEKPWLRVCFRLLAWSYRR